MRSHQLQLDRYDTDKIANRYLERYDHIFEPLVHKPIALLEIGVLKGGSLLLWRDYFPCATIAGIDLKLPLDFGEQPRIQVFQGDQSDPAFLTKVARSVAPNGFDVIIDDASHIADLTRVSFWHLFLNHLKPGGLFAIEDWGTGYFADWPDGKAVANPRGLRGIQLPGASHAYGMVGLVKELVDAQGIVDISKGCSRSIPSCRSLFDSLLITPGIVFVRKCA